MVSGSDMSNNVSQGGFKNMRGFRKKDQAARERFTDALRGVIYSAQPDISVTQFAEILTAANDEFPVSSDLLYKCIGGGAKFPAHKLWMLAELTGDTSLIDLLCEQHGGLFFEMAVGDDVLLDSLPELYTEFSEAVAVVTESLKRKSDSGEAVSDEELPIIDKEIDEAISAFLHVKAEMHELNRRFHEEAQRPKPRLLKDA